MFAPHTKNYSIRLRSSVLITSGGNCSTVKNLVQEATTSFLCKIMSDAKKINFFSTQLKSDPDPLIVLGDTQYILWFMHRIEFFF